MDTAYRWGTTRCSPIKLRILGPDHPDTLITRTNLERLCDQRDESD